jgi:hypothetical protein
MGNMLKLIWWAVPAQKPILHKNLSGLGIGLPMKIATDDF